MTLIRELIEIPTQVQRGDFVLNLEAGLRDEAATRTLAEYVVTPELAVCFEDALTFIRSSVDQDQRSRGAYLHGSFGSGKSHFMAVLHLLLQGHSVARAIPELGKSVSTHSEWMQEKNILLVPYHMIGAASVEAGILGGYARYIRRMHPDAPIPGFYQHDGLFEDAKNLRTRIGDDAFFTALNESGSSGADDDGWGELASGWDAASFDAAVGGNSDDSARAALVGDLVSTLFSSMQSMTAADGQGFVAFDTGLTIMTEHARSLGYDAVMLFLDELILWLASHMSNTQFINTEIQKIVKLVDSPSPREIPVVSLIARQRDLRDFVGDHVIGAEQSILSDALRHWEGRFHTITLSDNNLPTIASRRLLAPKDDAAKLAIDQSFEKTAAVRDDVFNTLLTHDGDREMFRKLYPFSPALVQALVALSSALQRERTALKVMLMLLVAQRDTLTLGEVIPVGDLYDVIAEEALPFSDTMRQQFDNAKRLLETKLIPMLEAEHGIAHSDAITIAAVDATAESPKAKPYRADLRLLKTLLLAALVPEVESFRQLTGQRIAALNHGTFSSPIPGRESTIITTKCSRWAGQVSELRVSSDTQPVVGLQLVGVDTQSIIDNASDSDNTGNRQRVIKALVFESIGIEMDQDLFQQHTINWRGTKRNVDVRFLNIREITDDTVFESRGDDWQVLIDYPFDTGNHSPMDDIRRIEDFEAKATVTNTLCWLPSFFSDTSEKQLGTLVRLDHILRSDDSFARYTQHLSPQDRVSARSLLSSQRQQLRDRLKRLLLGAFSVAAAEEGTLKHEDLIKQPLRSLQPALNPQPPVGATLADAFEKLMHSALAAQYPQHPGFGVHYNRNDLAKIHKEISKCFVSENGRIEVETSLRKVMREVAQPLDLGQMHERHFLFNASLSADIRRQLASLNLAGNYCVGDVRTAINTPQAKGMTPETENLLILVFVDEGNFALTENGQSVPAAGGSVTLLGRLHNSWILEPQQLVDTNTWQKARSNSGALFGMTPPAHLTASNQQALVEQINQSLKLHRDSANLLEAAVVKPYARLGLQTDANSAARLATARTGQNLIDTLLPLESVAHLEALATWQIPSSMEALGTSLQQATRISAVLDSTNWELLDLVMKQHGEQGQFIVDKVINALQEDEMVLPLAPVLQQATRDATTLLTSAGDHAKTASTPTPQDGNAVDKKSTRYQKSQSGVSTQVAKDLLDQLTAELDKADAGADLVDITVTIYRGENT